MLLHRMFFEELPDYLAGLEFPGCLANHWFRQVLYAAGPGMPAAHRMASPLASSLPTASANTASLGEHCPPPITAMISFLSEPDFLAVIWPSLSNQFGSHYTISKANGGKGDLQLSLGHMKPSGVERAKLKSGFDSSSRKLNLNWLHT